MSKHNKGCMADIGTLLILGSTIAFFINVIRKLENAIDPTLGNSYIVISVALFVVGILLNRVPPSDASTTATQAQPQKGRSRLFGGKTFEETLMESNFTISRQLTLPDLRGFLVDDVTKKIAIYTFFGKKLMIFSYDEMYDFSLIDDTETVAEGRAMATIAGTLVLGGLGAIAANLGQRKTTKKCSSLQVRIKLNRLDTPEIVVKYIERTVNRDSFTFRQKIEEAIELLNVLEYIFNQKAAAQQSYHQTGNAQYYPPTTPTSGPQPPPPPHKLPHIKG